MIPHILFAAYQVDRGSNGGMESATRIFEALAGDFRWTLMTNRETSRTERWRAGGARVVRFGFDENDSSPLRGARLALASAQAFTAARKCDVLHGNDIRAVRFLAPVARVSGKSLAFTLRDTKAENERYGPHWRRIARRLNLLVTLSDSMAAHVADRLPVPATRCHTINSIVDLESFHPPADRVALRARLGIRPDECAVGMVAGLVGKKRQFEVIRNVMPALADLPVRLHLIGDFTPETNAYAHACGEVAEELGDQVVFHGFRRDVADWLAALDIVLVASTNEGLARCMIEAMACGTPVVSFDVASAIEMLEDTGAGVVVPHSDWDAMVTAIRGLVADPSHRAELGKAGRQAAEARFLRERVTDEWRQLYWELAAGIRNRSQP